MRRRTKIATIATENAPRRSHQRIVSWMERARRHPEYFAEGARLDFTEAMCARLNKLKMSHYRLHKLSGVSKGQISKTFRHAPNLTIETMTKLALAVGMEVKISLKANPANSDYHPPRSHNEKRD